MTISYTYHGSSTYGAVWHWAGSSGGAGSGGTGGGGTGALARESHGAPLRSPNPDTASQTGYNIAAQGGKGTPQRRTWLDALSEGDKRELYGQGRPQAKDSSGAGTNWYLGTKSDPPASGTAVESRFFFEGTVSGGIGGWTAASLSLATDAREASRIGIFGTSNSYGGSYGRVTNEALGRDLNPLGRGGGQALVAGMLNVGTLAPALPMAVLGGGMQGNSVNNFTLGGGGPQDIFRGLNIELWRNWVQELDGGNHRCKPPEVNTASCGCDCGHPLPTHDEWRSSPMKSLGSYCECSELDSRCKGCDGQRTIWSIPCFPYGDGEGVGHIVDCRAWRRCRSLPLDRSDAVTGGLVAPSVEFTSGCSPYNRAKLSAALTLACRTLLGCGQLTREPLNCLRRVCGGQVPISVACNEFHLYPRAIAYTLSGVGCRVSVARIQLDFNKNMTYGWTAINVAHELMHVCDCKGEGNGRPGYSHNGSNDRCFAHEARFSREGKFSGFKVIDRSGKEAYAEACALCCFGQLGFTGAYKFPKAGGDDTCCLCKECY